MSAYLWRLTDDHAVFYTDDRTLLSAALAYARFPHDDLSRATTYHGKNQRVFAWQFTFPLAAWNGLVRHLGRSALTFLDEERPSARRAAPAGPAAPPAAPPSRPAASSPAPRKGVWMEGAQPSAARRAAEGTPTAARTSEGGARNHAATAVPEPLVRSPKPEPSEPLVRGTDGSRMNRAASKAAKRPAVRKAPSPELGSAPTAAPGKAAASAKNVPERVAAPPDPGKRRSPSAAAPARTPQPRAEGGSRRGAANAAGTLRAPESVPPVAPHAAKAALPTAVAAATGAPRKPAATARATAAAQAPPAATRAAAAVAPAAAPRRPTVGLPAAPNRPQPSREKAGAKRGDAAIAVSAAAGATAAARAPGKGAASGKLQEELHQAPSEGAAPTGSGRRGRRPAGVA